MSSDGNDRRGRPAYGTRPVGLVVTGANTATSSATHKTSNGVSTLCYTPTNAGTDTLTVFADNDGNGVAQRPPPRADRFRSSSSWSQGPLDHHAPARERQLNLVGTNHTVTATVTDGIGSPVEGMGSLLLHQRYRQLRLQQQLLRRRRLTSSRMRAARDASPYRATSRASDTIYAYVDSDGSGVPLLTRIPRTRTSRPPKSWDKHDDATQDRAGRRPAPQDQRPAPSDA